VRVASQPRPPDAVPASAQPGRAPALPDIDLEDVEEATARAAPRGRGAARRARRREAVHRAYEDCAMVAGPLWAPRASRQAVRFRRVATRGQRVVLALLVTANLVAGLALVGWLLLPEHVPSPGVVGLGTPAVAAARVAFCLVVAVELLRLVQSVAIWLFAATARDPQPMTPPPGLQVAILTTIVPSKEPIELVARSLRAMRALARGGVADVWILDEGDDPEVKAVAARLGVHHFSRRGLLAYNQPAGAYRARTKAGNHNAWRAEHEHDYDVVAQMDPDHVPFDCFLERTLGYFRDPDVAYVVAPQVYGNLREGFVTRGAAAQQYLFTGVVSRGGNGLAAPPLIGTNHLYRTAAWRQIGGYQDSIIEDHLTGMRVVGTTNPATGNRWKGVYTPDVLAIGEGPATWTDYFNQQKRWAYGVWEILLRRAPRLVTRLAPRQRLSYAMVRFFYPSVAATWVFGNLATAAYLLFGVTAIQLDGRLWGAFWGASMLSWLALLLWLRRFNLAVHERRELGVAGLALALFAGPVYVAAATAALLRRPLAYAVTAKGALRSRDSPRTFGAHLLWAAAGGAALAAGTRLGHDYLALRAWALLTVFAGAVPPLLALASRAAAAVRARRAPRRAAWAARRRGRDADAVAVPAMEPEAVAEGVPG